MTYGVPYSFVPGTKARADEVNANFIDVLSKIDDTNLKLTDSNTEITEKIEAEVSKLNTKIEELDDSKLALDLSNISADGQKLFDAKANASLLDGSWVSTTQQVCFEKSITPGVTQTISLDSFFPDKTNIYMFILDGYVQAGSSAYMYIESDKTAGVCAFRTTTKHAGMQSIMITGPSRTLKVINQSGSSGTSVYTLHIRGYRKIR